MLWITPIVLLVTLLIVLSIRRSERRIRQSMAGQARAELQRLAREKRASGTAT